MRVITRPHVKLVTDDNRIQIKGPSENGDLVVVEVDDCILKYCGSADNNGRPSCGLCLKKKLNWDCEILPEPIRTMISKRHILNSFLTPEEIDWTESSHCGNEQKRSNYFRRTSFSLSIRCEDFVEEVYCLLYSLVDAFQSTSCDSIVAFIGEFDQNANEECGLKIVQSNSFEGVISKDQSSRHGNQIITFPDKVFQGSTKDAKPNGMGTIAFSSGYTFIGNHNMGNMGFGFYGRVGSSSVISLWGCGNRDVFSIEEYGQGNVYIGGYTRGKRQGAGILILSNGSICFGEWKDGVLCGFGYSFGYTGHVYTGEMNRAFKGYGEMYYKNYSYYKGEWDGNQYSGKGVLYVQMPGEQQRYFSSDKWDHGSVAPDNNRGNRNFQARSSTINSSSSIPSRDSDITHDDYPHSAAGERTEELPC